MSSDPPTHNLSVLDQKKPSGLVQHLVSRCRHIEEDAFIPCHVAI